MAEDINKLKARNSASNCLENNLLDSKIIKEQFDRNLIEENLYLLISKHTELKQLMRKYCFV